MSADIVQHPAAEDPKAVWPGHIEIDRRGAAMAVEMLYYLNSREDDAGDVTVADCSALENWPRQGRPFRNVVAEYLARAQAVGPETVQGFTAILSDYVACAVTGGVPDVDSYDKCLGDDLEPAT